MSNTHIYIYITLNALDVICCYSRYSYTTNHFFVDKLKLKTGEMFEIQIVLVQVDDEHCHVTMHRSTLDGFKTKKEREKERYINILYLFALRSFNE